MITCVTIRVPTRTRVTLMAQVYVVTHTSTPCALVTVSVPSDLSWASPRPSPPEVQPPSSNPPPV